MVNSKKDTIIAIIGESGSGKSAAVYEFYKRGFNVIESYCDREPRFENEWGHKFISRLQAVKMLVGNNYCDSSKRSLFLRKEKIPDNFLLDNIIAYTYYNGHHYFSTRDQYLKKGVTFYIVEPSGINSLKNQINDANLIFINITADENIRLERMVKRELEKIKNYTPEDKQKITDRAIERINVDKKAFKNLQYDYKIFNNSTLNDAVEAINNIIIKK